LPRAAYYLTSMVTIIGVVFLAIGLGALYGWRRMRRAGKEGRNWPGTAGRVTATAIKTVETDLSPVDVRPGREQKITRYTPEVTYEYSVGPGSYRNSRLQFGTRLMSRVEVANVVSQYSVGREVTVYYDPGHPQSSVLERKSAYGWWPPVALLAGLLFATVGTLITTVGLYAKI